MRPAIEPADLHDTVDTGPKARRPFPMRQAFFALLLVGASFAGGAAVNGPGLRWAQAWALGRLGFVHEHDPNTPATDPGDTPAASPITPLTRPSPGNANDPTAVKPKSKQADDEMPDGVHPSRPGSGSSAPTPATTTAAAPSAAPVGAPMAPEPGVRSGGGSSSPSPPSTPLPDPAAAALAGSDLPNISPPVALPVASDATDPPATSPAAASAPTRDPAVTQASLGGKPAAAAPASVETEKPAPAPAASASAELPTEPADWAELRRALKGLGVSRYGFEAEADGRVRFYCVIPIAGRRAVGQHFEAEADDELQAARAVLRRVSLWRASEGEGAGQAP